MSAADVHDGSEDHQEEAAAEQTDQQPNETADQRTGNSFGHDNSADRRSKGQADQITIP